MTFAPYRWLAPALALLLVTALFTVSGRLAPRRIDRCEDPGQLLDPLAVDASARPFEGKTWQPVREGRGMRKGEVGPRRSRRPPFIFMMHRDWGLPIDFQNPGHALPHQVEADRIEVRPVEEDGTSLPVHYASQVLGDTTHFALYTYVYDGAPIRDVFSTRLRHLFDELIHGSRPVTLFLIAGQADPLSLAESQAVAERWIRAAWHHYRDACGF